MFTRRLAHLAPAALALTIVACSGGADSDNSADTASRPATAAGRIAVGLSAPEATLVDLDPCQLLTVEDATPHLDSWLKTEQKTIHGMKECLQKGRSFTSVSLQIGGMGLDGFEKKIAANHALMDKVALQEISGLGDKAYFLRSLWVHSGDYVMQVNVNSLATKRDDSLQAHLEAATQLANTIIDRL